ncbi:maltooligosyl trehalose synthase [Sphingobium sp. SYK-6]|uniref:malto-oligosyltrehalose synthase n=1 Tax=Sphingobium sp. (strain NBRC 103272 / SYK-6) TaxID=627192 RepID=UPI000227666F|nr:malto-oligosyltrehalose synthase [Sphingobium sp. SYK-6]BAK65714.1 maltooligosyl trehalose synthase [Sphingobium sp. SYK-6]
MAHRAAPGLVATYRVQLRNGVDLDAVRARIPWLRTLGISHLYLSPLFTAATGSTHGYDVVDPNEVDPALGGEDAFQRLAHAVRDADMGLVLDIVPNHMVLSPENPYLANVMREGPASRYAAMFDIDWRRGPLHFAVLDGSPADLLAAGDISLAGDGDVPALRIYDQDYPLREGSLSALPPDGALTGETLRQLLDRQHWSVGHWRISADAITHRRFFNISSLIGVRQEDPDVFDFTHRWIIRQVQAGHIQGLRVDHIDGLARPGAYLRRLRDAVGVLPIWVEKIVKEGEAMPSSWPVEGMSGYEFMAPVTQLLTAPDGLQALREAANGCLPADSGAEVRAVRAHLLEHVFAPELDRVSHAASQALAASLPAAQAVRAAIAQLALHWPVYRSYAADALPPGARLAGALEAARADRLPSEALGPVFNLLSAPDDPQARTFAARFEQLTGALTAKSEEDTVFFRSVAYLPFCEVGAEPDLQPTDPATFEQRMAARAQETPCALTGLSTHDTKRSADARAAIIALTYLPALGERLYARGRTLAAERALPERWGIYAAQVALMMYREPDRDARSADHLAKAMREAKDNSSHEDPAIETEESAAAVATRLMQELADHLIWSAEERQAFEAIHSDLVLAQAALQLTAPGIPDIYQGTELTSIALTDPDNRRPVDWDASADMDARDARKLDLTRDLLARRRQQPELFAMGRYTLTAGDDALYVRRDWQEQSFTMAIELPRRMRPKAPETQRSGSGSLDVPLATEQST